MKNIRSFFIVMLSALMLVSCSEEYLDTAPTDAVAASVIFQTTQGAEVALNGVYRWFYWYHETGHDDYGYKALDIKNDLMGNDMKIYSSGYGWFVRDYSYVERESPADETTTWIAWKLNYEVIFNANQIIANVDDAEGSLEEKNALKGQAYALRAYAYSSLAQWYANTYVGNESDPCVPIKLLPDEEHMPISSVGEVWNQAKSDIATAIDLLSQDGTPARPSKSQIDLNVAYGIQARIALVMNEWGLAITAAQNAREGYDLMSTDDFQSGFKDVENPEWIWGMDVNAEQATIYASFFSHMDPVKLSYASLGLQKQIPEPLYELIPDTDVRKAVVVDTANATNMTWTDFAGRPVPPFVSVRYLAGDTWEADYVFMRAAEMYLIEAEAAAENGDDPGAQAALSALMDARDPGTATTATGQALKDEIFFQRRIELWGEGVGLFDLKRKKLPMDRQGHDPALCIETDLSAEHYRMSLRIPQWEIDANDAVSEADQRD